jgi:multidrug resistance protein, MATE family
MSTLRADGSFPSASPRVASSPVLAEGGALLRLAVPIMLIALVNMGMSITDTAMVSMLFGAEALASVAVGSDLYSILFYLGAGTLGGLAPFYTAALVAGDPAERARIEAAGRVIVALLALALVPVVWSAPAWLVHVGIEPNLLAAGSGYTQAMALTLVPMLGVALYRTILTAAERPRVFLKVTLAMLPLNAAANWILMTGAGPIAALGPTGAGVSSLLVATASLALLVLIARRSTAAGRAPRRAAIEPRRVAAILRVGLPIGIATVAEVGVFLGATLSAARLGAADAAAHTLTLRTAGLAYAVPVAILQASMVRMARAEALGDPALRRAVTAASLALSLGLGLAICGLIVAGAGPLAAAAFDASTTGLAAAGIAAGLLVLLGVMELAAGPGSAAAGLLRGLKDTGAPMLYTLLGHWALGAPVGIYLCEAQGLGITGIWIGLGAGTLATTALTLARLAATPRRRAQASRATPASL